MFMREPSVQNLVAAITASVNISIIKTGFKF